MFSLSDDFENYTTFKPGAGKDKPVNAMLDQVVVWAEAMRGVRERKAKAA
jgi:hypothetical protein